jgi:hypothetical protein
VYVYLNFDLIAESMQRNIFHEDSVSVLEWGEFRKSFNKMEVIGVNETADFSESTLSLTMKNTGRTSIVEILGYVDALMERKQERDRLRQDEYIIETAPAPDAPQEYDYVEPAEDDK